MKKPLLLITALLLLLTVQSVLADPPLGALWLDFDNGGSFDLTDNWNQYPDSKSYTTIGSPTGSTSYPSFGVSGDGSSLSMSTTTSNCIYDSVSAKNYSIENTKTGAWCLWLYYSTKTAEEQVISKESFAFSPMKLSVTSDNHIKAYFGDYNGGGNCGSYTETLTSTAAHNGAWTHVCVVANMNNASEQLTLYINGEEDVTASRTDLICKYGESTTKGNFWTIGARPNALDPGGTPPDTCMSGFDGLIDEVKFYAGALTEPEVKALYDYGDYTHTVASGLDGETTHTIRLQDKYDYSDLSGITVTITGGYTNTTDATGTAVFHNKSTGTVSYNASGKGYFTVSGTIPANGTSFRNMTQSMFTNYTALAVFTNTSASDRFNITVLGGRTYEFTGSPVEIYLHNGLNTLEWKRQGWFSINFTHNVANNTNTSAYGEGAYNQLLNITAENGYTAQLLKTYNVSVRNGSQETTLSTTNGNASIHSLKGLTYLVTLSAPDYVTENATLSPGTATTYNYTFSLWSKNSVRVYIYDENNGQIITENITVTVSGNTSEDIFTTTTGFLYVTNLTDGQYIFKFEGGNYTLKSYSVTVADGSTQRLNAYLSLATSTVTFTILDYDTGSTIEGASVSMERLLNSTWTVVGSKTSDITGRAQFTYTSGVKYRFGVSATNYLTKTFILDPVLFSTYNVRIERETSIDTDTDYTGVTVTWSPTTYYNNETYNFTITFNSPEGLLEAYNYTITYPSSTQTGAGSNSYGDTLTSAEFDLSAASMYDTFNLSYCYDTTIGLPRCFSVQYTINGLIPSDSLIDLQDNTFGMGLYDRIMIATLITIIVAVVGFTLAGMLGSLVGAIAMQGVFVTTSFIPLWSILPGALVAIILIWRRGDV